MKNKREVLVKLFLSTLYLSAFTFGGGYVIVTLMKKKFVDDYHWIEENEMLDLVAIAQISGKAGGCLGGVFAGQNAQRQRDHSHQKGEQAVLEDGVHIALFNALIDDKGHDGGQKHIHHGFQSGKERCQDCGAFILAQM